MSGDVSDPEFLNELFDMNVIAAANVKECDEIIERFPHLPEEVIGYLKLSAETIQNMSNTMGRMGLLLQKMTEAFDRLAGR